MSTQDIIRAWKDADYYASLSDAQRAALPDNPAGPLELADTDLGRVRGAGYCGDPVYTYYGNGLFCNDSFNCSQAACLTDPMWNCGSPNPYCTLDCSIMGDCITNLPQ